VKNIELYKDKDWLYQQYILNKLNAYQIAKMCNIYPSKIYCYLKKYNIPRRRRSEAHFKGKNYDLKLSKEAIEFIEGELLGDGCLHLSHTSINACYKHSSKYKKYIEWLVEIFSSFGIEQSGKITVNITKNSIGYHFQTKNYPCLTELYKKWYPNGKKRVPQDIKLTPIVVRQWYIGDGSLVYYKPPKKGPPYILLHTCAFTKEEVFLLIDKLKEFIGIKARRKKDNRIEIPSYSVEYFLNYIGKCPKPIEDIYGYKWLKRDVLLLF